MNVSPSIFRLYDIRGVAGRDFPPEAIAEFERWYGKFPGINITLDVARAIGQAYGTLMIRKYQGKNILVGHELRPFADELNAAFIEGIRSTGCHVTDAGTSVTPLVYFSDCYFKFDGAVNITGSHNVYFYNGFKMMAQESMPVFGNDLQTLRQLVEKEDFIHARPGGFEKKELYSAYEQYVREHIKLSRPMKVIVDTGNGSAGLFARKFFTAIGCTVEVLYEQVDAKFPNHIPDPEDRGSLEELGRAVVARKADLGIGLDADGDRVGAVDERGRYVDADLLLLALARDVLSRHPGKIILYDVKCSRLMEELVPKYNGRTLMHMTGHAPIKQTLRQNLDIILAGEVSGHMYFVEDYFRIDDGMFAAARIIELASRRPEPFSALFIDMPATVRTPELKLPCAETEKFNVVEDIRKKFSSLYKTILIDGVRVVFDDHTWALVRASNTSPYLTVRMEADTEERLLEVKNIVADEFERHPAIGDKLNRKAVTTKTGRLGWV